jgi:hypothetical protein
MYVIDLRHFEGIEFEPGIPGPALRLAVFVRRVVRAETAVLEPGPRLTPLSCRRRPGHRPCPGRLLVVWGDGPYGIRWRCPSCGDDGMIDGWKGSRFDLSGAALDQYVEQASGVTIAVPEDGHRLLLDHVVGDPACELMLYSARQCATGVELSAGDDTWRELIGLVASDASLSASRDRRHRLRAIHSQLESAMSTARKS